MLAVGDRLVRLLYSAICRWPLKGTTDRIESTTAGEPPHQWA